MLTKTNHNIGLKIKILTIFYTIVLVLSKGTSCLDESIYGDPGITKIYDQETTLNTLDKSLRSDLSNFRKLSPQKQECFLNHFTATQDLLVQDYIKNKTWLTNMRLAKYGSATLVALAFPVFFLLTYNHFSSKDDQLSFGALPFFILQATSFYFFKFLEILSQKYISIDGAILPYEMKYIRYKPFFEPEFCKVFEEKLIAAHKTREYLYDYMKWFDSVLALPLSKKIISLKQLEKSFEEEFTLYPEETKTKIKKLVLKHMIHKQSRTIAHFWGPSGVGKSECVHKIARCTGQSYGYLALSGYTVTDLIGQGGTHRPFPGKIAEAILQAKGQIGISNNMVLFLDEVDNLLTDGNSDEDGGTESFLLNFLDPNTEYFYNPYYERNIYIKDLLIILGSIKQLKNDALRKRSTVIPFTGFESDKKQNYIFGQFLPKLYSETELYDDGDEPSQLNMKEHFSEKDKALLTKYIDEDDDKGLRSIQETTNEFVIDKIIDTYLKKSFQQEK